MWKKWNKWDLPTTVTINERVYSFETDFRSILEIFQIFNDSEFSNYEKVECAMRKFFPSYIAKEESEKMLFEDMQDAFECMTVFLNGNSNSQEKSKVQQKETPSLYDWEKDFNIIIAPINRVAGRDIRMDKYVHWWTFLSYFMEIGECTFSTYVSIRKKKLIGKGKLEKWEKDLWLENTDLQFGTSYTQESQTLLEGLKNCTPEIQEELRMILER